MPYKKGMISVIMPAYNEGAHIRHNIAETASVLASNGFDYEIIVVDDGSRDNTRSEALVASGSNARVKVAGFDRNIGKGNAIKKGFEHVQGEYVVFLDADLDLPPSQLPGLLKVMDKMAAHILIGSKYHPDSRIEYPAIRKVISRGYAVVLKVLFGLPLRDTQTGLKIFKCEVLRRVFPKILCKRWAYDLELLANAHRLGYTIMEAPVILNFKRVKGLGRMTTNDLFRTALDTLAIFYRMYLLKYYDSIKT